MKKLEKMHPIDLNINLKVLF